MRVRLRSTRPDEGAFYAARYPAGYRHAVWPDHIERVTETVNFIKPWIRKLRISSLADLSCGDGEIVRQLTEAVRGTMRLSPWPSSVTLGDLNPASPGDVHGALPGTLGQLTGTTDLYICSETLEHLPDPDIFLRELRDRARNLFISTPEGEENISNPEHYWGWDEWGVRAMLGDTGWTPVDHKIFTPVSADTYRFQMWVCS